MRIEGAAATYLWCLAEEVNPKSSTCRLSRGPISERAVHFYMYIL